MASDNDNPFSQQVAADDGSPFFASSSDGGAMDEMEPLSPPTVAEIGRPLHRRSASAIW
jgi:hypothetical protein